MVQGWPTQHVIGKRGQHHVAAALEIGDLERAGPNEITRPVGDFQEAALLLLVGPLQNVPRQRRRHARAEQLVGIDERLPPPDHNGPRIRRLDGFDCPVRWVRVHGDVAIAANLQGEHEVLGGNRSAVVPPRVLPELPGGFHPPVWEHAPHAVLYCGCRFSQHWPHVALAIQDRGPALMIFSTSPTPRADPEPALFTAWLSV